MTDFYTGMSTIADALLSKSGATCQLGVSENSSYNTATGKATIAYTNQNITAAVLDYPLKDIDGTLIKTGDKKVIASVVGLTADPKPGHRFTDSTGEVTFIVTAKRIAPASTKVLWILQVRK